MPESDNPTPADYAGLTPDVVLDAIEHCGYHPNGSLLALNSYENRVYQVGTDTAPLIAKFYRPGRWSNAAIQEEHDFTHELLAQEIPVAAPLIMNGTSLHTEAGYRFALFARQGGHWPELNSTEERQWMGRFIGRIHAIGSTRAFSHRTRLDIKTLGHDASRYLLENNFLPAHIEVAYQTLVDDLLPQIQQGFTHAGDFKEIRLHGDCHPGNVLWTDDGPHFVDLDDCRTGPAIQDIWMLISGERQEMESQLADILEGYNQFHDFSFRELHLVEPLRTLRMIHYAAWLARRWNDPAFPQAFPWFNTANYWESHILSLREQASLLNEPPLSIMDY